MADFNNTVDGEVISGGASADNITNTGNTVSISGGAGNDTITNSGADVTVNGGTGDDSIINAGANFFIEYASGDGNDAISGFDSTSTLKITSGTVGNVTSDGKNIFVAVGNNTVSLENAFEIGTAQLNIFNSDDEKVSFNYTGTDAETVDNYFENITIDAGAGADSIKNAANNVSINGGADNDTITNTGDNVTIKGGAGNDSISISGDNVLIEYASGEGNDTISGLGESSTLKIDGTLKSLTLGDDIALAVGENSITLKDFSDLEKLNLVNASNVPITFTDIAINLAAGGSSFKNDFDSVTINGGDGNDTITNDGAAVSINGGAGNDSIINNTSNISINGGAGDDTITNTGSNLVVQYGNGDGNDLIQGFNSTSTLKITSGTVGNVTSDGENIFVAVENGTVSLESAFEIGINQLSILDSTDSAVSFDYKGADGVGDTVDNYFSGIGISVGSGADSINNRGDNVTINGGIGADTIINSGANVLIEHASGDGGDVIYGFNETSTLKATSSATIGNITSDGTNLFVKIGNYTVSLMGAASLDQINIVNKNDVDVVTFNYTGTTGKDTVNNYFDGVLVSVGADNDSVKNSGEDVTINAGTGADTVENSGAAASIVGGAGNDSIYNTASNVIIEGGADNDKITNTGDTVTIDGGNGADTVENSGSAVEISVGAGADSIYNTGSNVIIDAGADSDKITNSGEYVTIDGGAGNDSVINSGSAVEISVGAGADSISNSGNYVTINAGAGNDTIINSGAEIFIEYSSVDGSDVIEGFSASSTLQIDGSITSATSDGKNITLKVGSNTITLKDAMSVENLNITANNDLFDNFVIQGTANADSLNNHFDYVTINGLAGNDTIVNSGENVTIDGGAGNDTIINDPEKGVFINYSITGGNDFIQGFNENSTLQLASGTVSSVNSDGTNLVLKIGSGFVTLDDAFAMSQLNILDSSGETITLPGYLIQLTAGGNSFINERDASTIIGSGSSDYIENSGAEVSINGVAGENIIANYGTDVTIKGGAENDSIYNEGNDVLFQYETGEGDDTITGFNDSSTLKVNSNVIVTSDGKNVFVAVDKHKITLEDAFNLGSLSIIDGNGSLVGLNYNGTDAAESLDNYFSEITIDGKGGDDSINNFGAYVSIGGGDGNDIINNADEAEYSTIAGDAGADSINNSGSAVSIDGGADNDKITNSGEYVTIKGGAGDDSIINNEGSGVVIQYSAGDGDDYIKGFDDNTTFQIMSGSVSKFTSNGTDLFLTIGENTVTFENTFALSQFNIVNAAGSAITLPDIEINLPAGGFSLSNTSFERATINGGASSDTISNYVDSAVIDGKDGGDLIANEGSNVSIQGGAGADSITNSGSAVSINAGAGNDTIFNEGSEVFIQYGGGSDLIQGFNTDSTLQINGTVNKLTSDGTDIVISVGDGSITLADTFALGSFSIVDGSGKAIELPAMEINGTAGKDSISNEYDNAIISGFAGNDEISNSGVAVSINGGEGADSIDNSGDFATITGGKGDDYITNSGLSVLFQYEGGNDYISGFGEDSTLKITAGSVSNVTSDGTNIYLAVGNDTVTVENAFDYIANIVDAGGNALNLNYNGTGAAESLDNYFEGITINGNGGADSINNYAASVLIDGGAGSDVITNENGDFATITGGIGDDSIISSGASVLFQYEGGNDYISGFSSDSTLKITSGTVSNITSDNENVFVAVGDNTITLESAFYYLDPLNIFNADESKPTFDYKGTSAAESLNNYFEDITINGNGGDDTINNYASSVTINGGAGDDLITNDNNNNATISGGAGADSINNTSGNILFQYSAGDGSDTIIGFNEDSTLQIDGTISKLTSNGTDIVLAIGDGSITLTDTFALGSFSVVDGSGKAIELPGMEIIGTAGGESILNDRDNATISGLAGNDSIDNSGAAVSINGGAGDDTISNIGEFATITGGIGDDYITNSGLSVLFQYEGGNDFISGFGEDSTLKITSGSVSNITSDGTNIFVAVGNNTITLDNTFYLDTLNIFNADGSKPTFNYNGTDAAETVDNYFDGIAIKGNGGNDSIANNAASVTINGGAGDDTVSNNGGSDVLIEYSSGDGNDLIQGFDITSTLKITADNIGNVTSDGTNIFVAVGSNTISIESAFDYVANIVNSSGSAVNLNYTGTAAAETVENHFDNITITGNAGDDTISNYGSNILFQYNTGDGNDVIEGFDSTDTIKLGDGTGTYTAVKIGNDAIVSFGGGSITLKDSTGLENLNILAGEEIAAWAFDGGFSSATYGKYNNSLLEITGIKSLDGVSLGSNVVTIGTPALTTSDVVIISDSYTLTLASGINPPSSTDATWNHSGTTATYTGASNTEGYTLSENNTVIEYTPAKTAETVTVSGVGSKDGLSIDETTKTVTVGTAALNNSNISITDGYSLTLASGISDSSTNPAVWSTINNGVSYKAAATIAGYAVSGSQIIYTPDSGGETFSLTGVQSSVGVAVGDKVVTVGTDALKQADISLSSDSYSLTLAGDVSGSATAAAGWDYANGAATYKTAATVAGYDLSGSQIKYTSANGGSALATITGVKSADGLTFGDTVTVGSAALDGKDVSISGSYGLTLDSGVTQSTTKEAAWSLGTASIAVYNSAATTAGYSVSGSQIIYSSASGGSALATITGVKSTEGLTFGDKAVTVGTAALGSASVSISGSYTLTLADGVPTSSITAATWTKQGNKSAVYTGSSATEGYTASGNTITYTPAKTADTFTLSGMTSTDGITVSDDKIVTLINKNLSTESTVTISDGYTLSLGSDVAKGGSIAAGWQFSSGNKAIYQIDSAKIGYTIKDNAIIYVAESLEGATLAELSGIAEDSTLAAYDNGISLTADNFAGNVSVVSSETRKFDLASGDYNGNAFIGTDSIDNITVNGSNVEINGGAGGDKVVNNGSYVTIVGGAGDDKVTMNAASSISGAGNIFVYSSGDGKDMIYDFNGDEDKIQLLDATAVQDSVKGKDAIFKVGGGRITVKDAAANGFTITVVGASENAVLSKNTYTTNGIISDDTIKLSASLRKSYTQGANISVVDGSLLKDGISIEGSEAGGSLTGGEGKDTIISNRAGDFALAGGKGNDLFVYSGGKDTISDYSAKGSGGMDKISVASSLDNANYSFSGSNVILTYGTGNELTITDGKGKDITFAGRKSTVKVYADEGVYSDKKKSLLLAADTKDSFSAAKSKKLVTINGSAVETDIQITGNSKANYIVASNSGSTINGGKGKDTLVGGDGDDVFIYANNSGNKVIENFSEDDIVSLGSGAEISQVTAKKGNVIFKIGSNTLTVTGMANSRFDFIAGGETNTYNNGVLVSSNGRTATLPSDAKGAIDMGSSTYSSYTNVSAELGKRAVRIIGSSAANSLIGGSNKDSLIGNAGRDTLWGGAGNDSLIGGDGADTFVYGAGEGTDTIADYNFADGDLLRILDKKGKVISKDAIKNATFEGEDLTLSIKGGGKLILEGVGTSATVNVNGSEQTF